MRGDRNQTFGQMAGGTAIASVEGQNIHIDHRTYFNADLDTIKHIVREELRVRHAEYGQPVNQGLSALVELMQVSDVKESVTQFRMDFRAASDQIDVIANYKALHDLLHTLEFECHSVILSIFKGFSASETDVEQLIVHELRLQELLCSLQQVAERETVASSEVRWLTELQAAQQDLSQAIEELDPEPLRRSLWLLNRVLATEPDKINTRLIEAARALRLPDLVEAMQFIAQTLTNARLNRAKLEQFEVGVDVLCSLNQRLEALVIGHDYWQTFDREMRRIEATLGHDLFELQMSWPYLKNQANQLIDADADNWTISFLKDSQNLDMAIRAENPTKIRSHFRRYRRRASQRFFQVDVTLKRICEELRVVGGPLAMVLRMME
ncbi:MAG: hypothetical protein AAGL17_11485 [Cyanobacteria bacterium J06576_12]